MDFRLDETEEAFRQELRRFATKTLAGHYQADDKTAKLRPELVADMAGMGLTGLRIPDQYGGQQASAVIAGIAAEEVGRADFNATYLIINTALISDVIVRNASAEQKAAWLPAIASGVCVPCICITEPGHGTDAASLDLKAVADGDGWRLYGEKTSITLGMDSDRAVVLARTPADPAPAASARSGSTSRPSSSHAPRSTTSAAAPSAVPRSTSTAPQSPAAC